MLCLAIGLSRVLENYPNRAGIQYAVAAALGLALMCLGALVIVFPYLVRGLRRWAALVRQEWQRPERQVPLPVRNLAYRLTVGAWPEPWRIARERNWGAQRDRALRGNSL
jgi:hypothetical protein